MNRPIVLANQDYLTHTTNEGNQLQLGLQAAGWDLIGDGYPINLKSVPEILERRPPAIFVQDKRDWDPKSGCCFDSRVEFQNIQALQSYTGKVAVVVKDAGREGSLYHRHFCEETKTQTVVLYYHPESCLPYCPWLSGYNLVRTYHSLDPAEVPLFVPEEQRERIVGSGAVMEDIYPIRHRVANHAHEFSLVWIKHPGYSNRRCDTPRYLQIISQFKVHLATASTYQFALRKIIETVACGGIPVTDLPRYDKLPVIDDALWRISPNISDTHLKRTLQEALESWNEAERRVWAQKALAYYDYYFVGQRLSRDLLG